MLVEKKTTLFCAMKLNKFTIYIILMKIEAKGMVGTFCVVLIRLGMIIILQEWVINIKK